MLIPSKVHELTREDVDNIRQTYAQDILCTQEEFRGEVQRWQTRWGLVEAGGRPKTLLGAINSTGAAYPKVRVVLLVLLTMPATSATCERSFSSMKRIKTYLRSSMTGDRLSSLGMLHIHREAKINVETVIDKFASEKNRNLMFI